MGVRLFPFLVAGGAVACQTAAYLLLRDRSRSGSATVASTLMLGNVSLLVLAAWLSERDVRRARDQARQAVEGRDFAWLVADTLGEGVSITDEAGRFVYVNPAYARLLGRSVHELIGRSPVDFTVPEDLPALRAARTERLAGKPATFHVRQVRSDGTQVYVRITGTPRMQDGRNVGAFAVITDLTERRAAEVAVALEASYTRALVRIARLTEGRSDPTATAERAAEIVAQAADVDWAGLVDVRGHTATMRTTFDSGRGTQALMELLSDGSRVFARPVGRVWEVFDRQEAWFEDAYDEHAPAFSAGVRSAAWIPVWREGDEGLILALARLGSARAWSERDRDLFQAAASSVRLALERQQHLARMERHALEDALTGLGNRRAFEQALARTLDRARRHDEAFALVILDLDGLKAVNDHLGHAAGDALLRDFAHALRSHVRGHDLLFRLGGDEFALLVPAPDAPLPDVLLQRVERAVASIRATHARADVSAGVALFPEDGRDAHRLLRAADDRMYANKRGKQR